MPAFNDASGTTDFQQTRDQLLSRSLRQCSAIAENETPSASMIATASVALNALVKQWDASGIHLWTESEGVVFPKAGQRRYMLDKRNSPDHAAQDWALTSLTNSLAAGGGTTAANNLQLDDINTNYGLMDVRIGDRIGVGLDDGTIFWTGITYVPPPGQAVTALQIFDALPSSASAGQPLFIYRQPIEQPLRIAAARRLQISTMIEVPLLPYSRLDYEAQPNKDNTGTVTAFFYNPQLISGWFNTWPSPLDTSYVFRLTFHRRIKDFNAATDVPDLPAEWLNCLAWNVAKEIGPEYDIPLQKYQIITTRAAETLDMCSGFDKEPESIFFGCAFEPGA